MGTIANVRLETYLVPGGKGEVFANYPLLGMCSTHEFFNMKGGRLGGSVGIRYTKTTKYTSAKLLHSSNTFLLLKNTKHST